MIAYKEPACHEENREMSPLPLWVGSHNLYRSVGRPVLVDARTTIGYYHQPLLVDS
ncbi:hypothetical protein HMPREF3185_00227 [Porphyromonas somerae]|uniref:Uncharacterized protein n=1 Tax=Porphyromonas somerae TaxID=322095 RepID=A0A134BE54_9PORP|nr:hypothetical protein HMPREF3184_00227 [Porphyromonadaceae bacterium KA00676]KXB78234.1 hypothetical protein HMPREF3185_00227 [Porphyromonas somerae]